MNVAPGLADKRAPRLASTVTGPVSADRLGITLMHEHVIFDFTCVQAEPQDADEAAYVDAPVSAELLGFLRFHPVVVRDSLVNRDEDLACEELTAFLDAGGSTVVDPTNRSIGRDPEALRRLSERSGVSIIMGSGHYIDPCLDATVRERTADDLATQIIEDITAGVDGTGIRAGLIGEIGTSAPITSAEETSLRASAIAQAQTGAPLMVHLDGWGREGHRVLDLIEEAGGDIQRTVLCHMNPSSGDDDYQASLADRGGFLEFDMLGNNQVYDPPLRASPDELVSLDAIGRLLRSGRGDRLLISQDVFLKMMFQRYGGYGYVHILRNLPPLFEQAGIGAEARRQMLIDAPARLLAFLPA